MSEKLKDGQGGTWTARLVVDTRTTGGEGDRGGGPSLQRMLYRAGPAYVEIQVSPREGASDPAPWIQGIFVADESDPAAPADDLQVELVAEDGDSHSVDCGAYGDFAVPSPADGVGFALLFHRPGRTTIEVRYEAEVA